MSTLTPIITSAGLNAVFNAQGNGLEAEITEMALGDVAWNPDNTATQLQNEVARINVTGERLGDHQIHVTGVDEGVQEYWVREIGFYLADGTLLAIWSVENQSLAYKSAGVDLLLSIDLVLSALPANSVTVDGTGGFSLPAATEDKRGIVRLGNAAEVAAGLLDNVAVSPKHLKAAADTRYVQLVNQLNRNFLINGNFNIWQRANSLTLSAPKHVADRWIFEPGGGGGQAAVSIQVFAVGQTDVPHNPKFFHRVNSVVAPSSTPHLSQRIKSVRTLAGKSATISFYAKSPTNKDVTVGLVQNFGVGGAAPAALTVGVANVTNQWQKFVFNVNVPGIGGNSIGSYNTDFLALHFYLPSGYDEFDIAQVQFEEGNTASTFELLSDEDELSLCKRYYWKTVPQSTLGAGYFHSSGQFVFEVVYPEQMIAPPDINLLSAGGLLYERPGSSTGVATSIQVIQNNVYGCEIKALTINSLSTTGYGTVVRTDNNNPCLEFVAEL